MVRGERLENEDEKNLEVNVIICFFLEVGSLEVISRNFEIYFKKF